MSSDPSSPHSGYVGAGSRVGGVLQAPGPFEVNGRFDGEIHSDDELIVGRTGDVRGKVLAQRVVVEGAVQGEIEAQEVAVRAGARIRDVRLCAASLDLDPDGDAAGARITIRKDFQRPPSPAFAASEPT